MTAQTPAPWTIEKEFAEEYWCPNDHFNVGPARAIFNEADAALIAAAPDLLDAILDFAEAMRQVNDTPNLIDNTHALQLAVNKARIAINKATGGDA